MDDGRSPSCLCFFLKKNQNAPRPSRHTTYMMRVIRWPADTSPLFCSRSKRVDRGLFFVHEENLAVVDLTSHVGAIRTWLVSYFLALCDIPLLLL